MPPVGVTPNFVDPPNSTYLGIVTDVLCLFTVLVVASFRIYVKIFCVRQVRIEDCLVLAVLATYIGCIYCNVWMMEVSGLFIHQWNVRLKVLPTILYTLHIGSNLTAITILVLKGAILREWIRIFVPYGTRNSFFWTSTAVLVMHTLFHSSWIIAENLACTPHKKIWDPLISSGHCINVKGLYIPAAAVNLFADIIVLLLPQKVIWSLQMSRKTKIGVSLIFTIGFLACLAAIFRLYATIIFYNSDDEVYTGSAMYLWALAEMTCLFLVFCVPAIPKAFAGNGLRYKIKAKIPQSWYGWAGKTTTSDDKDWASEYSRRRREFYSHAYGQPALYKQYGANLSDILRTPSIKSFNMAVPRGPVVEITADSHRDNHLAYHGAAGILCTTEFTAEVTQRDEVRDAVIDNVAYQQYQWEIMH
ncbi:hypothetical protein F5Y16DRAFT_401249 [Xylariaceae sp. FL0255]|nr:hypothetical protein F5Y16DRAFT_401249 [Xylariaceae sp. FL0255]